MATQAAQASPRGGKTILVVDDEPRMIDFIRLNLEHEQHLVIEAHNGLEALDAIRKQLPQLVLLDIMMPELDGFETLRLLREYSEIPVILLSARGEERDISYGLDLGADDYITKPFSPRILLSRIKAVLRRVETLDGGTGSIEIDERLTVFLHEPQVRVDGEVVKLRPTEFRLLSYLVQHAGKTIPHRQLLRNVWGPEYRDEAHYVRLYVNYLREKIEVKPAEPAYILTERGFGYRFVDFRS